MSDGQRSGRSTGRVSCKSTELKRCSMIEMRWNKYEVSLASPVLLLLLLLLLIAVRCLLTARSVISCRRTWRLITVSTVMSHNLPELSTALDTGSSPLLTLLQCLRCYFTSSLSKLKVGVKRELLDIVIARKLAYCGHTMRKQGSCWRKR